MDDNHIVNTNVNNNNYPRQRRRQQRQQLVVLSSEENLEEDEIVRRGGGEFTATRLLLSSTHSTTTTTTTTMADSSSSSYPSASASSPYLDEPHSNGNNHDNIIDNKITNGGDKYLSVAQPANMTTTTTTTPATTTNIPTTSRTSSVAIAAAESSRLLWKNLRDGFGSLNGSPSELYYAYVLKFLDSYSYFSFSIIFTLFLSEDFKYGDVTAGTLYGSWGALTTIYGLLTGFVIDNIGVSKSLKVGYSVSLLARIGIFVTTSRTILLLHILITLPLGTCLGIPVLTTGIRRYTTTTNRGFAFGLFYVVMNIAALVSGPIVDILSIWYKGNTSDSDGGSQRHHSRSLQQQDQEEVDHALSLSSSVDDEIVWTLSSYRAIILSGIVSNAIACLVTMSIREIKVQQTSTSSITPTTSSTSTSMSTVPTPNNHNGDRNDPLRYHHIPTPTTAIITAAPRITTTATITATTTILGPDVDEPASIAIPPSPGPPPGPPTSRMGNNNDDDNSNDVTAFRPLTGSPTQILRETCRSPSFRRFLLVCLIMLNVRMVFRHLDATLPKYMIREFGPDVPKGTIYAINPALIIVLVPIVTAATSNVEPLVMMHYGSYISAASVFILAFSTSIWACVVFVTVLSIGEAIWSPRLYDYSVSVCREGREGTYMALTSMPLFLAKLPVGFLSGLLLQRYCPEDGERNSQVMWLIIGLITATSPVFMTCCWSYISRKANDDEEPDRVNYTELRTRAPTVV